MWKYLLIQHLFLAMMIIQHLLFPLALHQVFQLINTAIQISTLHLVRIILRSNSISLAKTWLSIWLIIWEGKFSSKHHLVCLGRLPYGSVQFSYSWPTKREKIYNFIPKPFSFSNFEAWQSNSNTWGWRPGFIVCCSWKYVDLDWLYSCLRKWIHAFCWFNFPSTSMHFPILLVFFLLGQKISVRWAHLEGEYL